MKKSVLIADHDTVFVRELLNQLEQSADFCIVGLSANGADALRLLKQWNPDVLLLNLLLPVLDGLRVLEMMGRLGLRKRPEVILVSDIRHHKALARALSEGAAFAVLKPVSARDVVERMRMVLEPYQEVYTGENPADTLMAAVTRWLHICAIPPNLKGYWCLRDAIALVVQDNSYLGEVTRRLYPAVAKKNNTTPSRTERAIRHAISRTVDKTDPDWMLDVFQTRHPVNSEFIAASAEKIAMELKKKNKKPRTR